MTSMALQEWQCEECEAINYDAFFCTVCASVSSDVSFGSYEDLVFPQNVPVNDVQNTIAPQEFQDTVVIPSRFEPDSSESSSESLSDASPESLSMTRAVRRRLDSEMNESPSASAVSPMPAPSTLELGEKFFVNTKCCNQKAPAAQTKRSISLPRD